MAALSIRADFLDRLRLHRRHSINKLDECFVNGEGKRRSAPNFLLRSHEALRSWQSSPELPHFLKACGVLPGVVLRVVVRAPVSATYGDANP